VSGIKSIVKNLIPEFVMQRRRRRIAAQNQQRFAEKTVAETFSEIYEQNIWGGAKGEFYSGDGSTERYSEIYAEQIQKFFADNRIKTVVDLGCGDFRVASKFVTPDFNYVGVDVVPKLIAHLNETKGGANVEFRCLNIIEDKLPTGDACLIREVLQHLSNAEISKVLDNCLDYKFVVVTECYPNETRPLTPNLDIPHGPDMRLHFDSAVCLNEPPFNRKNIELILDVEAKEGHRIKTFVIHQ
jgi:SAM-dependent methyltransferase